MKDEPHLHFEVRVNGTVTDPLAAMGKRLNSCKKNGYHWKNGRGVSGESEKPAVFSAIFTKNPYGVGTKEGENGNIT